MKEWIDEIIENTINNYKSRKIVIWGSHDTSKIIAEKLNDEHNIMIEFLVDSDKSKAVYSPNILKNMSGEYYVIIPLGRYKSIKDMLYEYGYVKDKDYCYFCDCAVVEREDYYEDIHGNKIYGKRGNAKFVLTGYNSEIFIGENVKISNSCKINICSKSIFKIGDNSKISEQFMIGNNTNFKIGDNSEISGQCIIRNDTNIEIGDNSKISEQFVIRNNTNIKIGNESEISGQCIIGNDTKVEIGDDFKIREQMTIGNKSDVEIGDNSEISGQCIIGNDTKVEIGDNFKIREQMTIGNKSNIKIGDESKISGQFIIRNNTNVEIEDNFKLTIHKHFIVNHNANLKIGSNSSLEVIKFYNNSEVKMGNNAYIYCNHISIAEKGILNIGNDFSTALGGNGFICVIPCCTSIYIGNDCMFSYNIILHSSDSHTIFDIKTRKNINSTLEISKNRMIIIGNHVWIGAGVTILYNTKIGDGSIIGAGSVVKSRISNNCIAAGNIARVVRKDVAWSRNDMSDNILDCGEEYINLTEM